MIDRPVRIALAHFVSRLGDAAGNLAAFARLARAAGAAGAEIICGPERCLDGCVLVRDAGDAALIARIHAAAEPVPGPSTERLCRLAKELGAFLAIGLAERDGERYYNAAVLASPGGELLGVHRKTQCPVVPGHNDEACVFARGDGFDVLDTPLGRVGMLICYERRFGENTRLLALGGAEIVLCLSAGLDPAGDALRARARAEENGLFFAHAAPGGGLVAGPSGEVLAERLAPGELPAFTPAELDPTLLADSHARRQRYFEHRAAELYGPIAGAARPDRPAG